jgi:hypothetical protein
LEEFKGVCVAQIGGKNEELPPVRLTSLEQAVNYVMLHRGTFPEVIIEDSDGFCILHAKDGEIVFPVEFQGR